MTMSDEEIENLKERIAELEDRVGYLESEVDASIEDRRFERKVERVAVNRDVEMVGGEHRRAAQFEAAPGDVPRIAKQVDEYDDIGWTLKASNEDVVLVRMERGLHHSH